MKVYLTTSFSLAMLKELPAYIRVEEIPIEAIPPEFINAVGHESTAKVISRLIGKEIHANRVPIHLEPLDTVIVFQVYKRPAEGQVYTEQEIEDIVNKKLYKILQVEVR